MTRLILIGAGTLGGAIGARWVAAGGSALALTRTSERHPSLRAAGLRVQTTSSPLEIQPQDRVVIATPGSDNQRSAAEELRGVCCARVVFVSTTGYYAGLSGPVEAGDPPGPGPRAQAAAAAERAAAAIPSPVVVVRLGGLYQTGRGPVQALLRRGAPPMGPPDRPLALLHYHDAATAILAALHHPEPEPAYIAVTPPLPTREDFYRFACDHHGLSEPGFAPPTGEPAISYDIESLRRDLLPSPAWPDWRAAARS